MTKVESEKAIFLHKISFRFPFFIPSNKIQSAK